MSVQKIQTTQPNRNIGKNVAVSSAIGAVAGAGARYIMPTKSELSSIVNKDAVDTFVSSAATSARGANRSILKYGGIGALIAGGLTLGAKLLSKMFPKTEESESFDYSKMNAFLDAPDYAVEIMWYGE